MDLLNLLNKVKVQTLSFEKHPVAKLDDEIKIHYLNGLSLIMVADEDIKDEEKEYLSILINSFGLSDELLDSFVEFAKNPDEKAILEMMKAFMSKEIKYNFMIDAMMIAHRDGEYHENEKAVIDNYFEMFKITEDEKKDLIKIFEMFYKQDGNGLFRYFGRQNDYAIFSINFKNFKYLIDYYNIDFSYELQKHEKELFKFESFFKPKFEQSPYRRDIYNNHGGLTNGGELSTSYITNEQYMIFLNYMLLHKKINIENDKLVLTKERKSIINLEFSNINFNKEKDEFFISNVEYIQKRIEGVRYEGAIQFINWLNEQFPSKDFIYDLPKLWGFSYYGRDDWSMVGSFAMPQKVFNNEICIFAYHEEYSDLKSWKRNNFICLNTNRGELNNFKEPNDKMSFRLVRYKRN